MPTVARSAKVGCRYKRTSYGWQANLGVPMDRRILLD